MRDNRGATVPRNALARACRQTLRPQGLGARGPRSPRARERPAALPGLLIFAGNFRTGHGVSERGRRS
eukprot:9877175-Alexandrium_andersonii.AAC.1